MSFFKKILGAAAIIGAAALVVGTGGLAAPGVGLLVTSTGTLTLGANLAVSLLLSFAASRLTPKPKMPNYESSFRGRMLSVRQPVAPRELVYGEVRKGGNIIFVESSKSQGQDRFDRLDLVVVLASHPCEKIGTVYFNGQPAVFDGDFLATGTFYGNGSDAVWAAVERHTGQPGIIQPFPDLKTNLPSSWTDQHSLKGVTAIHVVLFFNPDKYPSGIPNITADILGKNDIFNPTIGAFGYTNNSALCISDYLINQTYGVGMGLGTDDGLDTDTLNRSVAICEEVVLNPNGTTGRRYRCNGVLDLSQDKKSNIEAMLTSMAGDLVYDGGKFYLHAGYYRTPTQEITPDDIRSAGLSMATRVSRSENFNGVRGQFISPENDWQPDDFPSYQSATYLAEDNGQPSWQDVSLPFTTSAYAAQRLAKISLEKVRRQISVSLTLKLQGWRAQVGDVVNLTYPRWGFDSKPFYVKAQSLKLDNGSLVIDVELQETSPLVYDATASEFSIYQAAPRTNLPSAFLLSPPVAPQFNEELYITREGTAVKNRLTISWVEGESLAVERYQVERQPIGGEWLRLGESTTNSFILEDAPSGMFKWRIRAVNALGVRSDWVEADYTVDGLLTAPQALTGVRVQQAGGIAILSWDRSPDLDVIYGGKVLIRHASVSSPDWGNGTFIDEVTGSTTIAAVPLLPGTYLLRAVDSSGNLGPAESISTDGIQAVAFTSAATTLVAEPTWSGTKVDTSVDSTDLRIDSGGVVDTWADWDAIVDIDNEGGILPEGSYQFSTTIDLTSVKNVRLRRVVEMSLEDINDDFDLRAGSIDTWLSFDGPDGDEVNVEVQARTTEDDPSGTPTWSDWFKVDSTEVKARGVQGRAILTTTDPNFNVRLSSLQLVVDEAA